MEIIGIDHGYSKMKGMNFSFTSGITPSKDEPYPLDKVLHFNNAYYICGNKRMTLSKNKMENDNYYLLTLAGIAEEIKHRGLPKTIEITLAAGLPLTEFSRDKDAFHGYLFRDGKAVYYEYEGENYYITIREIFLFPQGYAGIIGTEIAECNSLLALIDIGGWTIDHFVMQEEYDDNDKQSYSFDNRYSHQMGVITLFNKIMEQVRRETATSIRENQIESVLRKKSHRLSENIIQIIQRETAAYAQDILNILQESNIDTQNTPLVFMGGGSLLIKDYLEKIQHNRDFLFVDSARANVEGYEELAYELRTRP